MSKPAKPHWTHSITDSDAGGWGKLFKHYPDDGETPRQMMINENQNSSLMSALLLTISVPLFLAPPHYEDTAQLFLLGKMCLTTICVQLLALMISILQLVALNKIPGDPKVIWDFTLRTRAARGLGWFLATWAGPLMTLMCVVVGAPYGGALRGNAFVNSSVFLVIAVAVGIQFRVAGKKATLKIYET